MAAEHLAWINGEYVPPSRASLSIFDASVLSGAIVSERLRTFRHEPFLLDEHLARLAASSTAAFIPLERPIDQLRDVVHEIVRLNAEPILQDEDLTVSVFATAGTADGPTLCVHASPLPATLYAPAYEDGISLVTPPTQAIPAESLSPQIKTRNRLHWHIADAQAGRIEGGAKALLLDRDGHVTETATGNLFIVFDDGRRIAIPRRTKVLRGISQSFVLGLVPQFEEADLRPEDVATADEVFVTSSVYCMLPVVRLNGSPIGDDRPGPVYHRLLTAWSESVGVDIAAQMQRMAKGERGA